MNCTTAIFAITPTPASVIAGATLPLAQTARRISPRLILGSDSVTASAPGYYKVSATVTFTAPAAGVAQIQLHKNGVAVPGITSSESVVTATTEVHTLALEGIVRVMCGETAILTLVNAGIAIDTSNIALSIERID